MLRQHSLRFLLEIERALAVIMVDVLVSKQLRRRHGFAQGRKAHQVNQADVADIGKSRELLMGDSVKVLVAASGLDGGLDLA